MVADLTADEALRLLSLHLEWGADEAVMKAPRNRLAAATKEKAEAAPPARRSAPPPVPAAARPLAAGLGPLVQEQVAAARETAAQAQSLEELRAALERLEGVGIKKTATQTVFADGNPKSKLMLIGEAPGADEDRIGKPFVGASGRLLDRMMAAIGRDRSTFYITNVCFWRPPGNRKPTEAELAAQFPFVQRHIELIAPKLLVLIGASAAQGLLGTKEGITRLRGRWFTWQSEALPQPIPAMPIFHPAYLLRQPAQKRETWSDLLKIKQKLDELGV